MKVFELEYVSTKLNEKPIKQTLVHEARSLSSMLNKWKGSTKQKCELKLYGVTLWKDYAGTVHTIKLKERVNEPTQVQSPSE